MKKSFNLSHFLNVIFIIGGIFAIFAFPQTKLQIDERGYNLWLSKRLFLLISYSLNILGAVFLPLWKPEKIFTALIEKTPKNNMLKVFSILFFAFNSFLIPYLALFDGNQFIVKGYPTIWTVWWLSFLSGISLFLAFKENVNDLLSSDERQHPITDKLPILFGISLLIIGVLSRVALFLPTISSYPFSLGWSEGSRYYYASLFFSQSLYGEEIPWTFLHPTRYILQSIPFLLGKMPIWLHRSWQVILWIGLTAITSLSLAKRITRKKSLNFVFLSAWMFVFLFQGAVYYHLLIAVTIIFLGVKRDKPTLSFLAVILASLWAGISRLNWMPVPAMLAIMLYFLEEPVSKTPNLWQYLKKPILWGITGTASALFSQNIYIFISGNTNNLSAFGSSFTSLLLWYRLLPNDT